MRVNVKCQCGFSNCKSLWRSCWKTLHAYIWKSVICCLEHDVPTSLHSNKSAQILLAIHRTKKKIFFGTIKISVFFWYPHPEYRYFYYKLDVKLTLDITTNKLFYMFSQLQPLVFFIYFRLPKITYHKSHDKEYDRNNKRMCVFFGQYDAFFPSYTLSRSIRCDFYGIFFNCCHYILR